MNRQPPLAPLSVPLAFLALLALLLLPLSCGSTQDAKDTDSGDARPEAPELPQHGKAAPLRVMSFNIRYDNPRDGANVWIRRRQLVLETIRDHGPDLLGLQEALAHQASFLTKRLPDYASYGPGRDDGKKRGEACTLLWRRERFELIESRTLWLSETPDVVASVSWDSSMTRIVSYVRLRERDGGQDFVFANTHFDHRGKQARLESARLIARMLPSERLVLTGDLNAGEDTPPLRALREAGFVDSFRVLHPEERQVGTFNGWRERGRNKIDYVLVRGPADITAADIDARRPDGRWPSDHLPVLATLRWR
jgi:endonuclease/exonuclease/phosphatase family metal-dependent hydrolase